MRGLRSLIILLVIAIALGWYAYRDSQKPLDDGGPKREKVFAVEADKIEEIAIKSEAGEQTRLTKAGTDWKIVAPTTAQPDTSAVSGLTTNLSNLEIQRVVDENPPELKEYGLAQPRIEVSFKAGGQEHTLLVGHKTPPGTDLYAKRGSDNRVFLIASHLESTFNRSTFDLRDKSVLKVDREKVDALEFSTGNRSIRFARPGGEWQIAAPIQARADFNAVDSLARRLAGLQMTSVVDEAGASAAKFGLERPAATVRLSSGSSQATLAIGAPAGEKGVYARDLSRPAVFTVEASVLDELKKELAEYRQKDLFDARSFNATRLEIVREGQTHAFEKTKVKNEKGQEEEKWRQIAPQARELDQPGFDKLLSAVTGVRATSFVDQAPAKALAAPSLTVAIKFDEGKKEERVTFASAGTDVYAARAGEPGAAKIDTTALDSINNALQELK
jgi:hypothetical protein